MTNFLCQVTVIKENKNYEDDTSAAIITHNGRIFATQRGYGEFKDSWEFPGGKIEPGGEPRY